jgi:hypothetical protein
MFRHSFRTTGRVFAMILLAICCMPARGGKPATIPDSASDKRAFEQAAAGACRAAFSAPCTNDWKER